MKKLISILIIFVLISLLMPSFISAQTPSKYALIVSYDSQGDSRIWASHCARLLQKVLKDNGFSQKNIILDTRASYRDLIDGFGWLDSVEDSGSEVVVGFFGHGSGTHVALKDVALNHSTILQLLSNLESQKQLVIIDTCGSGGAIIPGIDGVSLNQTGRVVLTSTSSEKESSVFTGHLTDWCRAVLKYGLLEGNVDSVEEAGALKGGISDGYEGEFIL